MSEYLFKIVVIGDPGVGKTQMRYRFTQNVYNDNSKTTIGVDFATKLLVQNNGEMVKGKTRFLCDSIESGIFDPLLIRLAANRLPH